MVAVRLKHWLLREGEEGEEEGGVEDGVVVP